jgi:hypothetical protein
MLYLGQSVGFVPHLGNFFFNFNILVRRIMVENALR